MSARANKAVVRRLFEELWNQADYTIADQIMAPDKAEGELGWARMNHSAFPDLRFMIDDQVAEADKVATAITFRATHEGVWDGRPFGLGQVAPTGKRVEIQAMFIHRVVDGRIVAQGQVAVADWLTLAQQLGIVLPRQE